MKNRANIAASILQSPEILESAYESSANAAGSAMEENEKYLDSIEGKLEQFSNRFQELWYNLIDSDLIKGVVDLGTQLVNILAQVVDKIGLIGTAAAGGGIVALFKNIPRYM